MRIVAQRELAGGVQEIVTVDKDKGVTEVLVRPDATWTYQAPKTMPNGQLMAYRLKPGEQFNLHSDRNEIVIFDGPNRTPRVIPRPVTKSSFGKTNGVMWLQHGHAAPTTQNTLIHAAVELETWWLFGWPIRKQWMCIETDLAGRPTGARWVDQAEPSWTPRGLTRISTAGNVAIITPTRTFDKGVASIGSKSWGWFDPHLSPDGTKVVWLDVTSIGLDGTRSGLILGDVATGRIRYLITPTYEMQTDAMWLDDDTLIGSRYIKDPFASDPRTAKRAWWLMKTNTTDGGSVVIPNTENCTVVHATDLV